jgi:AmiR/NasT family two-component response regulator
MSSHRLLLADDDRLILSTLGQGLRDAGYEILEATDGKSAVHICERSLPDLAILDIRMPGISGVEAAHQIREKTKTPFIFLSAYGDKEVVQLAVQEGALAYLVKPVDIPQIVPTIEAALARAEELAELRTSTQNLNSALDTNRETSMAVGLVMERYRVNRDTAFKILRNYARSERLKLNQLAADLLNAAETISIPSKFFPKTTIE